MLAQHCLFAFSVTSVVKTIPVFTLYLVSSPEKDPKYPSMAMLAMKTPMEERHLKTQCTTVISSPQTSWPTSLNSPSAQCAQPYSHCLHHRYEIKHQRDRIIFLLYILIKSRTILKSLPSIHSSCSNAVLLTWVSLLSVFQISVRNYTHVQKQNIWSVYKKPSKS